MNASREEIYDHMQDLVGDALADRRGLPSMTFLAEEACDYFGDFQGPEVHIPEMYFGVAYEVIQEYEEEG